MPSIFHVDMDAFFVSTGLVAGLLGALSSARRIASLASRIETMMAGDSITARKAVANGS